MVHGSFNEYNEYFIPSLDFKTEEAKFTLLIYPFVLLYEYINISTYLRQLLSSSNNNNVSVSVDLTNIKNWKIAIHF